MARISGVTLPKDKRVEIGLTYILGIGRSTANKILKEVSVDPNIRVKDLTEDQRLSILNTLSLNGKYILNQERFNTIGPVVGNELKEKAYIAIILVVLAIILFIAL